MSAPGQSETLQLALFEPGFIQAHLRRIVRTRPFRQPKTVVLSVQMELWSLFVGKQTDHVQDVQIGGSQRRLPVLDASKCGTYLPVDTVPKTRADCPTVRPCVHWRCRHHLWRIDSENRAGRPGLSSVERDARGWTKSVQGSAGTSRPPTTLEARWLEQNMPDSCALDVAGRGAHTNDEVGVKVNRHRTLVAREIRGALERAIDVAEGMGVDKEDLIRALMQMGVQK